MKQKNILVSKVSNRNRNVDYLAYAQQYKELIELIISKKEYNGHDYEFIPLLFIFSRYLELSFKGLNYHLNSQGHNTNFGNQFGHDLDGPFKELTKQKLVRKYIILKRDINFKEITMFVSLLNDLNKPNGQGLMYPEDKNGISNENSKKFSSSFKHLNDPKKLFKMINIVMHWLENVEGDLDKNLLDELDKNRN